VLDLSESDIAIRERTADKPLLRGDRSYLVTGGLSGFGLATAEWLVSEGARTIVLGSRRVRSGADAEAAPALDRMRERGASVSVITLDVSSQASVNLAIATIRATMPALAGIVHSAALLDDKPLAEVDRTSLEPVLGAKALGAWHLHEATRDLDLDHFVLFSSVSALVGNAHQAAYAAANAFLDGLAYNRRALGLRAMSISWGALGDVGLVAREATTEAHLRGLGLTPIPASEALAALKAALLQDRATIGIFDANWGKWMANFPDTPWNRLDRLREESANDPLARLRAELAPLSGDAKRQYVRERVAEEAASVLHTDAQRIDAGTALRDLGLDSLMAVELQLALEGSVGVSVPTIELLGASIATIVERTLDRLQDAPRAASVRHRSPRSALPRDHSDLRAALLERICVQPPYFALEDLTVDGELIEATARPAVPSECENHFVNFADAARHLATLGSCAASLKCHIPGKVYYPVVSIDFPDSPGRQPVPSDSQVVPIELVRLRARCTKIDLRSSRAIAETELLDSAGKAIAAANIEYHVIPEQQFAALFRDRAERTHEQGGTNPYATWRPLPQPEHADAVARVELGMVSPLSCLGHFVGYPALPVSMMGRDAIRLIAEGVAHQHGWRGAVLTVVRGGASTSSFVFAHEPATMVARRAGNGAAHGHEVWECNVYGSARLAVRFEFELIAHEARPFSGFQSKNRDLSPVGRVTAQTTLA
jgi:NAD(P)-dependent dehydrogenase (short-subunit alcohol dehydrogenase family)